MINSCDHKKFQKLFLGNAGFTLLEVLFAIVIVAVGLLAVAHMQLTAVQGNRAGGNLSVATHLAEQELERLKASSFDGPDLAPGNHADPNNPVNSSGNSGGIFTREWLVEDYKTSSKRITITVSWDELLRTRSTTLTTITQGGGI